MFEMMISKNGRSTLWNMLKIWIGSLAVLFARSEDAIPKDYDTYQHHLDVFREDDTLPYMLGKMPKLKRLSMTMHLPDDWRKDRLTDLSQVIGYDHWVHLSVFELQGLKM